jgi:hypothetical protein
VNLDRLVSAGYRPWKPTADAHDVDAWDKYDFPNCGTYRLGKDLIIFTLITTGGTRSLWAYVPVPGEDEESVCNARFDTPDEFDAFLASRFAGLEAVFAAAEDFVITSKSDGILIPSGKHKLLLAGAKWYSSQPGVPAVRPSTRTAEDADSLLREAQGALAAQ